MNSKTLAVAIAYIMLTGCSQSVNDTTLPPDAEHGLVNYGGADSFEIAPGTSAARALLAFVNQPIADGQAAEDFRWMLDGSVHPYVAQNIVAFRVGDDGKVGDENDTTFTSLEQLDQVRWVGPVALLQLHELAQQHGYGVEIRCDELMVRQSNSRDRLWIRTLADLEAVEASGCNFVDGNLIVELDRALPAAHSSLQALAAIENVTGELRVDSEAIESVELPNLVTAGVVKLVSPRVPVRLQSLQRVNDLISPMASSLSAPNLVEANAVEVTAFSVVELPKLRSVQAISTVSDISFATAPFEAQPLELPLVERVGRLFLLGEVNVQLPNVVELDELWLTDVDQPNINIANVERITSGVIISGATRVSEILPKLVELRGDLFAFHSNEHPVTDFSAFNALQRIEGDLRLEGRGADIGGFAQLVSVEGDVVIDRVRLSENAFAQLDFIGGDLTSDELESGALPRLTLVGGTLTHEDDQAFTGLQALKTVEGDVLLAGAAREIQGLRRLTGVGGDLVVRAAFMNEASDVVERFVAQLDHFAGDIVVTD